MHRQRNLGRQTTRPPPSMSPAAPRRHGTSFDERCDERIAEMLDPLAPDDTYDTCAHGVSFDEWCDECIAEMHDALG